MSQKKFQLISINIPLCHFTDRFLARKGKLSFASENRKKHTCFFNKWWTRTATTRAANQTLILFEKSVSIPLCQSSWQLAAFYIYENLEQTFCALDEIKMVSQLVISCVCYHSAMSYKLPLTLPTLCAFIIDLIIYRPRKLSKGKQQNYISVTHLNNSKKERTRLWT